MRIGIDLMGSGSSPRILLEGILSAHSHIPAGLTLVFLGTPDIFEGLAPPENTLFHPVHEVIEMEDPPLLAVRRKKDSSIVKGVEMLKNCALDALISAGNTGALLTAAKLKLNMLPGVARPALLALIPTRRGSLAVLDVGANASFKPHHLVSFACMGALYQKSWGVASPKVGLLNIGVEAGKGTPELKQVYDQLPFLEHLGCHFVGNIEARSAFEGEIDVLVTDGFTGNVFLKTAEGIASVLLSKIEEELEGLPAMAEALGPLRKRLQYTEYPGALLVGIDKILIKCHGNPTPINLVHSIIHAEHLFSHQFLKVLKEGLLVADKKKP